jgi:hypothetical protein
VLGDRALSYARVAKNSEQPFFLVVAEKVFDYFLLDVTKASKLTVEIWCLFP